MDRVGIIGENSIEYVEKIFDAWAENKSVVLIDWRIPPQKSLEMMRDAEVSTIYIESSLYYRSHEYEGNGIPYYDKHEKIMEVPEFFYDRFNFNQSEEEALILFSSGTTGKSKGIIMSHRAINENIDGIANAIEINKDDVLLVFKALAHSSSIIGELLLGIRYRCKTILARTSLTPRVILNTIDSYKVTYTFMNPSLLKIYTKAGSSYDLRNLKAIYVYGAKASIEVLRAAHRVFKYTKILCGYGQTEAGPRVTMQLYNANNILQSAGPPLKNVEIAIVGNDGEEKKVGKKGFIYINTPSRFSGYISRFPERESNYRGWLNSGDIGYVDEQNNLYVVGRADNSCLVGAHIVYLEEVEEKVNTYIGIDDCLAVYSDDNLYGDFISCYYTGEYIKEKDLRRYLKGILAPYEIPKKFFHISRIPLTQSGKKKRTEIREILEEYKMESIKKNICEILEKVSEGFFTAQLLLEENKLPDELDSIMYIEFIVEAEEFYEIEFDDNMLDSSQISTISELAEYINRKRELVENV